MAPNTSVGLGIRSAGTLLIVAVLMAGCTGKDPEGEQRADVRAGKMTLQEIEALIAEFEPAIAHFPPDVEGEEELKLIEEKYDRAKQGLDQLLKASPESIELLLKRGHLQRLGHNLDKEGAWNGSEADLKAALDLDPKRTQAMLELAVLYINSDLRLAKSAQDLLELAQKEHGEEPLYDAQRNLFLAIYLQGEFEKAHEQAKYFVKTFPDDETSKEFLSMIEGVLSGGSD